MYKPPCPFCNSHNTYQHSGNTNLYEEFGIAQTSYRCRKCKKYFYRTYTITDVKYTQHPAVLYEYDGLHHCLVLNPKRDDPLE